MNKFWTKSYPEGVPAEIDIDRYTSLVDLLNESIEKYAERDAYIFMGKSLTYSELGRLSRDMGAYLQSLGLEKGDRVAIMMPNVLQYPIATAAVLQAGYIIVNVNPLYTARELEHQLNDSGAKAIIILENFASILEQVITKTQVQHVILASVGERLSLLKGMLVNFVLRNVKKAVPAFSLPKAVAFNKALEIGKSKSLEKPTLKADDVAVLQYTGGTTGLSKGAVLLHRTVIANLLCAEAWMKPGLERRKMTGQAIFVCALPLYHVFAFVTCSLLSMRIGGANILIPNPRDLPALIKEISKHKFNVFPAVNTLYNALANNEDFKKLDFSELGLCVGGGMAIQEAVAKRWYDVTGCSICEGYGLSETASGVVCNPADSDEYSGTIGLPLPNLELQIVDEEGKASPIGETGEIALRGPQIMQGYWQLPEETKNAFTEDGFFKTGDIGITDERGYTKIVDRKKDMILVSGFNVFPNEVESVAVNHPDVLEAAVVGVPDEQSGEAVMLFAIKKNDGVTEKDLKDFCRKNLTGYKCPKYVEFREDLPRTNVGKILRRELRDEMVRKMAS